VVSAVFCKNTVKFQEICGTNCHFFVQVDFFQADFFTASPHKKCIFNKYRGFSKKHHSKNPLGKKSTV
jgi:hypothetical protein